MKRIVIILAAVTAVAVLVAVLVRRGRDGGDGGSDAAAGRQRSGPSTSGNAADTVQELMGERFDLEDDRAGNLRLEGLVVDEQGEAAIGARVVLGSLPPREVTTEDGSFTFDGLISRTYLVAAHRGDAAAGPVSIHMTADFSEQLELRLRPAARVEIEVVDASAATPVAGALVELRNVAVTQQTSDAAGSAVLRGINPGTHVLKVAAAGFASVWQLVTVSGAPGEVVRKRVELRPGVAVAGTVVDPAGRPVEGARVNAEPGSAWDISDGRLDSVITDARGRWQLTGLARQTFRFRAFHPELAPGFSEPVPLTDGVARDDIVIRLELGGRLAGTVVNVPKEGAWVHAASEDRRSGPIRRVHVDADGRFALGGLPRTRVKVVALSDDATSELLAIDLEQRPSRDDITLSLSITGAITGTVITSSGEEVPEARVIATPFLDENRGEGLDHRLRGPTSDIADQVGQFRLAGLAPGQYRLRAIRPGSSAELLSMRPGVVVDAGSRDVKLTVDDLTSMTGQVRFRNGGTPDLFQVRLGASAPRSFAGTGGKFHVDEVPAGKQLLTISGPELVVVQRNDVTLTAGEDNDLGVVEVDRGRRVRGRVTSGGTGVAGAQVVIGADLIGDGWSLVPFRDRMGCKQTVTGADGSYVLAGIGPTDVVVVAERDGVGRSAAVAVPPGMADLTIDLAVEPYGSLKGHLRVNGKPPVNGQVFVRPFSAPNFGLVVSTGTDGSYHFDRLAPSDYLAFGILGVDSNNESGASRKVIIRPGVTETVDFDLREGNITLALQMTSPGDAVQYGYGALVRLDQMPEKMPTTISEGRQAIGAAGGGAINEGFIIKDRRITFDKLAPGGYAACVAPLWGPPDDPAVIARMQANLTQMPLYCKPFTLADAPPQQSVTVEVQPLL